MGCQCGGGDGPWLAVFCSDSQWLRAWESWLQHCYPTGLGAPNNRAWPCFACIPRSPALLAAMHTPPSPASSFIYR